MRLVLHSESIETTDPTEIVRRPCLLRQEVWIYKVSPPQSLAAADLDKILSKRELRSWILRYFQESATAVGARVPTSAYSFFTRRRLFLSCQFSLLGAENRSSIHLPSHLSVIVSFPPSTRLFNSRFGGDVLSDGVPNEIAIEDADAKLLFKRRDQVTLRFKAHQTRSFAS
ncbi:hypothetical protein KSP39_PZI003971 [Platanthera zijinensis]|uniref:Uncharacterized protein n=1 Tax=Platanthera zijinensis TaxID=2320716 RepID=A0AAP0BVP5_9ASPA